MEIFHVSKNSRNINGVLHAGTDHVEQRARSFHLPPSYERIFLEALSYLAERDEKGPA